MPEFVKNDSDKLRWSLLPLEPIQDIIRVLMHGSKKYSDDNWKLCKDPNRYYDACVRHISAWRLGESCDKETGYSHLAHAGCCILFMLWFEIKGVK